MSDSWLGGFTEAAQLRQREREFAQEQAIREREMSLREAAERRLAENEEYGRFMGPAAGMDKTPFGGVIASDAGVLDRLYRNRNAPSDEDLAPGMQGPPALETVRGRENAADAARASIESKIRDLFMGRAVMPAEIRAAAAQAVADKAAQARIEAARIAAEGAKNREGAKTGQKTDTEWRTALDKYSPYTARTSTALGMSGGILARMREVQALPESVDYKLTPNEVTEFWTSIARNIGSGTGGGQVAHSLIQEIAPQSAAMDAARLKQYVSGIPQDANAQEFTKRGMKVLARMDAAARQNIKDGLKYAVGAHRSSFIGGGDEARRALKESGFSDQELDDMLGGRPAKILMTDPQGTDWEFDPGDPEIDSALKNGWNRKMGAGLGGPAGGGLGLGGSNGALAPQ